MKEVGEFKVNTGEKLGSSGHSWECKECTHGGGTKSGRQASGEHIEVLPFPWISLAWEGRLAGSLYDIIRM